MQVHSCTLRSDRPTRGTAAERPRPYGHASHRERSRGEHEWPDGGQPAVQADAVHLAQFSTPQVLLSCSSPSECSALELRDKVLHYIQYCISCINTVLYQYLLLSQWCYVTNCLCSTSHTFSSIIAMFLSLTSS